MFRQRHALFLILGLMLPVLFWSACQTPPETAVTPHRPTATTLPPTPTIAPSATPQPTKTAVPSPTVPVEDKEPPRITNRQPFGPLLTDPQPTIHLTFSQPMNPERVATAFQVSPPLSYTIGWPAEETAVITPTTPLAFDTTYTLTFSTTAIDQAGTAISTPYQWRYQLKSPINKIAGPDTNQLDPLTLHFNYPLDPASLESALRIEPDLPGDFTWDEENNKAVFTPSLPLPPNTIYQISFRHPLQTPTGWELPMPDTLTFTSPPALLERSHRGGNNHPAKPLSIRFDRPINLASLKEAFTITPTIAGTLTGTETTLYLRPESHFVPHTTYRVTIDDMAVAADGTPLFTQPYSWGFSTGALNPVASFGHGPNAQVLDANGRRAIQFQRANDLPHTLYLELYRLSLSDFLNQYTSGYKRWNHNQDEETAPFNMTGAERVKRWAATRDRTMNGVQEAVIPDDVPPGLYILNLSSGFVNDQLLLSLTENTLMVKQTEEHLLAWVSDINGAPVSNLTVGVYARDGSQLAEGQAEANGTFRAQLPLFEEGGPPSLDPLIVIARAGNDVTVSGLGPEWRSAYGPSTNYRAKDTAAYIITDRPIYKPGQTVNFKATLRRDDDARLTIPPAGTAVTVRIRDARDNVVRTYELASNDFGSVNGSFAIAEGAMVGAYRVEAVMDDVSQSQTFSVEDYRKPEYEVSLSSDAPQYVLGDTVVLTVEANYYFGEPVADAEVTLSGWTLNEIEGRTDSNGRFTTTISADDPALLEHPGYWHYWYGSLRQGTWRLEATVDDGSRLSVSNHTAVTIYNAAEIITLGKGGRVHRPGQSFNVDANLKTIAGDPVSERQLTLTLRRWNRNNREYSTVVQTHSAVTDGEGKIAISLSVEEAGFYQLRLSGEGQNGEEIYTNRWIYIYEEGRQSWYGRSSEDLSISADRTQYAPGDTARLFIESTFDGPALLLVERGTIRREQLVSLTAPVTMVQFPIQSEDIPNIHISVNAWQAQDTALPEEIYRSLADSHLHTAYTKLAVPATEKQLMVAIAPDKSVYTPREEATFTVRVTNWKDEPVSAEVSLAMVDEAIFALQGELSGPIYDAFYFPRPSEVRTANSMNLSRYLLGMDGGMGGGGGGNAPYGGAPRQDFPDTAAWFPTLRTDHNGEVSVTVTLPDNLTSWRLTAKAATADTQVGQTTANITTHQQIIARPILPRALTAGDTAVLSALVHNYTNVRQTLTVTLNVQDLPFTVHTAPTKTVVVSPNTSRIIGWWTTAEEAGEATMLVTAVPDDSATTGDAIQLPLTVNPLAVPDVSSEIGQFNGRLATTVTLPPDALPLSTVQIQLARSIAGSLLEGLDYLTGYPYGCVEQTMSKALPNAVVGRALFQLGIDDPTLQADLPDQIGASVQRLYGFQHNDGGWGWWYDDDTHDYQTAWVIFGLSQITEAGYEVDPQVIERGTSWLNEHLAEMDPRTQAFALYAMAAAGRPNQEATLALVGDLSSLEGDTFSIAGLALALHTMGETAKARELVVELGETAVNEDGYVHWEGAAQDGHYRRKVMASDVRSTALALSALVRVAPGHELEPGVVRWLMAHRRGRGWGSTNETAFAIIGLTDHLLATSYNQDAETPYTVSLNGAELESGRLAQGEPAVTLELPASQLDSGDNELVITTEENDRLYYTINSRVYLAQQTIDAAGRVEVRRVYRDPDSGARLDAVAPGEMVEVELQVDMPQPGAYMIVEDRLPGGLEALNENLNTTSHVGGYYQQDSIFHWRQYGYNYKEIRGDRVSFFITDLPDGERTFTYYARATHAGTFSALPTEAYAMYDASLWGRSASDTITINEAQ